MGAPVIFTEEHSPRGSKAFPGGQQSCDTADMAQCSSQQSGSLLGREISQNSTGEFPVQARIILSAFALIFSTPSFSISSGLTTDIWKVTDSPGEFLLQR